MTEEDQLSKAHTQAAKLGQPFITQEEEAKDAAEAERLFSGGPSPELNMKLADETSRFYAGSGQEDFLLIALSVMKSRFKRAIAEKKLNPDELKSCHYAWREVEHKPNEQFDPKDPKSERILRVETNLLPLWLKDKYTRFSPHDGGELPFFYKPSMPQLFALEKAIGEPPGSIVDRALFKPKIQEALGFWKVDSMGKLVKTPKAKSLHCFKVNDQRLMRKRLLLQERKTKADERAKELGQKAASEKFFAKQRILKKVFSKWDGQSSKGIEGVS